MALDELLTSIVLLLLFMGIPIIALRLIATEPGCSTSTSSENDLRSFGDA